MSVHAAFASIIGHCADHLVASAGYARRNDNPEGVHQLRIAIRRLRAAMSDFRQAAQGKRRPVIVGRLRAFQQQLGAAREWDVLIDETIGSMPRELRGRGLRNLIEAAEVRRAQAHKRVRAALDDPRYDDLLRQVLSWKDRHLRLNAPRVAREKQADSLSKPVAEFAGEIERARREKVQKLGKKIRKLDVAQLHELRILVKKLRYTVEFFSDLFPGRRAAQYLSALKKLQQVLGTAHDAVVAVDLVTTLETGEAQGVESIASTIRNWASACHERDRRKLVALWRRFEKHGDFCKHRS